MAELHSMVQFVREELRFDDFDESGLNGLQVEGRKQVSKIVAAVDAAYETAERAVAAGADLLLVHHGLFWGKPLPVVGSHRRLIDYLLKNELSVLAVHLPLDAHETCGNNFEIARGLGLAELERCLVYEGAKIGCRGSNSRKESFDDLVTKLQNVLGTKDNFLTLPFGPQIPKRIAVVSGAAADALYRAEEENFDTLITGEPRYFAYHFAKERQLNVIFAGHYATETLGIKALARTLADKFKLSWEFIDCPTGI